MTQISDDFEAVNHYIMTAPIKTKAAQELKTSWINWFQNELSWYDKNFSDNALKLGKNKRNDFNLANTRTKSEKEAVKQHIATGMTTEEARGKTREVDSSGYYVVDSTYTPVHKKLQWYGFGGLALVGVGWVALNTKIKNFWK